MFKEKLENFWTKNYKWLMLIPIILLAISFVLIGVKYARTGDFLNKDVSLKGGIAATIDTDKQFSEEEIKQALGVEASIKTRTDTISRKNIGYIIEVSDLTDQELKEKIEKNLGIVITEKNYSQEETKPKLGEAFFKQLIIALIFAFILMGITVFITFKTIAPSIAVIFAALTDIVITLAFTNIIGLSISTAGIVAFLLIIGYSVDTDILLTNYAIKKREEKLFDRMFHSMKTGLTMTLCACVVMLIGLIFSTSEVITEMFIIILIALIVDMFSTYLTNAGILWIYCKKKRIS
ncbi:hypothetical protein J4216_01320 [Candidatus Woesearchaeota archaeon]|nr:hypothetical protein [Candidatus Woesearchaeota archaeon]